VIDGHHRVTVIAHFDDKGLGANGQVERSRQIRSGLARAFGRQHVQSVDTAGSLASLAQRLPRALRAFGTSDSIIVLPGARAVRWLLPQLTFLQRLTGTPVHLVAIGGSLPSLAQRHPTVLRQLRKCAAVYVQTQTVRSPLVDMGVREVVLLPNFRRFDGTPVPTPRSPGPLRLAFVSRLLPDKGLEVATQAVRVVNERAPGTCELDVYGPIEAGFRGWFEEVRARFPPCVQYRRALAPCEVVAALREADCLVHPTRYHGEGCPGVFIESMIAGTAIVASDWNSNREVLRNGAEGVLCPPDDPHAFAAELLHLASNPQRLMELKQRAASAAMRFHADAVMPILLERLLGKAR
jgi:glycosyltransferase involved in cell wall biosynthesis